ncbi:MAG: DinB family protein [Phycisphaerales bacterium]|nr:DinB family protein [Phycisphaerales bacterium]
MPALPEIVLPSARLVLMYSDMLVKDIPAEQFGVVPEGVNCNSPAYNYGHMALYADMCCDVLGRKDLFKNDAKWKELYEFGAKSEADPAGKRYGRKDELLARFKERQETAMRAFAEATPEALDAPMPEGMMGDVMKTKGAMAAFMLTGHPFGHLGQISTWRRCMGLPMIF